MKLLDKIKKLKEGGLITEKEYNEIKQTLKNQGLQDLTKNDSYNVDNHELPEQGKLTNHEQKIINKYKDKGIDFTNLVLILNQFEKEYKEKYNKK